MFARFTKIFNWIKSHKYLFVTIIFLVIVVLIDDKSMIKHFENRHKMLWSYKNNLRFSAIF